VSQPVVDFIPTTDSLFRNPGLAYVVELPVLGIRTRYETNSRYVSDVVQEAFGTWSGFTESLDESAAPELRVQIVVNEGSERADGHAIVRHFCPDPTRVIMHSPGSVAYVDPLRGEALVYVSTALAGDRAHLRVSFLEAATLALTTHYDRHPIHAAAIRRGDRTVLLAGPSGTGKSTLAYMAYAAGLDVLSDDLVWVQLAPRFRLWGWPRRVHLMPDAHAVFPELGAAAGTVEANGTRKLAVDLTRQSHAFHFTSDRAVVCLLERGHAHAGLERLAPLAIADALTRELTSGFDRYPERLAASVAALTSEGGWRLGLTDDPHDALHLLKRLVDED
jgi:hypothetical protein